MLMTQCARCQQHKARTNRHQSCSDSIAGLPRLQVDADLAGGHLLFEAMSVLKHDYNTISLEDSCVLSGRAMHDTPTSGTDDAKRV